MGWVVKATSRPLFSRERPGTFYLGCWMGLTVVLDRQGKSRSTRDSIPEPSNPQQVTIPTALFRLRQPISTFPKQASNPRSQWFIPNPHRPFIEYFMSSTRIVQNLDNVVVKDALTTQVFIFSRYQQKRNCTRALSSILGGK